MKYTVDDLFFVRTGFNDYKLPIMTVGTNFRTRIKVTDAQLTHDSMIYIHSKTRRFQCKQFLDSLREVHSYASFVPRGELDFTPPAYIHQEFNLYSQNGFIFPPIVRFFNLYEVGNYLIDKLNEFSQEKLDNKINFNSFRRFIDPAVDWSSQQTRDSFDSTMRNREIYDAINTVNRVSYYNGAFFIYFYQMIPGSLDPDPVKDKNLSYTGQFVCNTAYQYINFLANFEYLEYVQKYGSDYNKSAEVRKRYATNIFDYLPFMKDQINAGLKAYTPKNIQEVKI